MCKELNFQWSCILQACNFTNTAFLNPYFSWGLPKKAGLEIGRGLPCPFLKIGKKYHIQMILGKGTMIVAIYGLNFSFKFIPKFLPAVSFFLVLQMKCLSKFPNSKKTLLPWQIPGFAPVLKLFLSELLYETID